MFDPDEALTKIKEVRTEIDRRTRDISVRYELADRGSIAPEDLVLANEDDRKRIHDLALEMFNFFDELSDHLEFGGVLPNEWRTARQPVF